MLRRTAFIILNWNSREMTAECIRSILAMDASEYEIVVVDNGSRDGSVDYLRNEFPRITLFPQEKNLGFAAGCNVGMRYALAQGFEYVLLVNNDTVVDPRFLSGLLEEARKVPDAALLSPKIYFYDCPDRLWWAGGAFSLWVGIAKHVGRKQIDTGQCDLPGPIAWATGCAVLIRSEALKKVGLFDERLFGNGEDLELCLRIRRAGYLVWFVPQAKLWHKEGVDYRKNAGEHVRKFTGTRNLLWIMNKHANTVQWISFLPNFIFRYALFYILLSIWRGDARSARAVCEGILAFLRMRSHPDRSPLPPELSAGSNQTSLKPFRKERTIEME
jgi:GT2 family glycosyltransferase